MFRRLSTFIAVLLLALLVAPLVSAREQVPADNQALLLMRILAYDRKAPERAAGTVRVVMLARQGMSESESACRDMSRAVASAARKMSISGLPVHATVLHYSPALEAELGKLAPTALYVCPGLEGEVASISKATRSLGVLSFSGEEASVNGGLAVGLVRREAKAAILVNLKASRAEGADLDSGLLRIAEVIR